MFLPTVFDASGLLSISSALLAHRSYRISKHHCLNRNAIVSISHEGRVSDSYVYHYDAAIAYAVEPSKNIGFFPRWWNLCRAQCEGSRGCVTARSEKR